MNRIINVAVVGYKGAGKSTLISAISKVYGNLINVDDLDNFQESNSFMKYKYQETEIEINGDKFLFYEFENKDDYLRCGIQVDIKFDAAVLIISALDGLDPSTFDFMKLLDNQGITIYPIYISGWLDYADTEIEMLELLEDDIMYSSQDNGVQLIPDKIIKGSSLKALKENEEGIFAIRELIDYIVELYDQKEDDKILNANDLLVYNYVLTSSDGGLGEVMDPKHSYECVVGDQIVNVTDILYDENHVSFEPGSYAEIRIKLSDSLDLRQFSSIILKDNGKVVSYGIIGFIFD